PCWRAYRMALTSRSSSSAGTVRRSNTTAPSSTRQNTGGRPWRRRAATWFASLTGRTSSAEGSPYPGSEPPPATASLFRLDAPRVSIQEAAAQVVHQGHLRRAGQPGELAQVDGVGETDHAVVARMDLQDEAGPPADGPPVVAQAGPVGGPHLDQSGPRGGHD